ncbi:MAG: peptidoglycan DD-metalloendopeptidase family protein [Clostridia bacterium]|nr:peptidoglycan DD-metalloendopeptidase family protein [Clostridia bacterium]
MEEKYSQSSKEADATASFNANDTYYEDDTVYAPFSESEDYEIIIPTEENEEQTETASANRKEPQLSRTLKPSGKELLFKLLKGFMPAVINIIFLTGDSTIAVFRLFFSKLKPFILFPFRVAVKIINTVRKDVFSLIKKAPASFAAKIKALALEKAKEQTKKGTPKKAPALRAVLSLLFSGKRLLKTAVNLALPLIMIAAAVNVYLENRTDIFALQVIYNGTELGYVESKEVFEDGKARATSLIKTADSDSATLSTLSVMPVYKMARVGVNELSNSAMISEKIIETSDISYTRACGIYIDGEFLCAVKHESDAITVFEALLEPYKKQVEEEATVAFVEEIDYVSGLYPENSELIWDTSALRDMLSNPKQEAVYHTFGEGDTVKSVRLKYGLTLSQLQALNPDVDLEALEASLTSASQEEQEAESEDGSQTAPAESEKPKQIRLLVSRQENYVRVKVMKTNVRTEEIPFQTVERNSSSLAKGTKKTSQEGRNGTKEITELITYIDGVASYTTVVSEKTIRKPTDKIILIGTKTYSSGSSSSSGWTWPTRGAYHISSYYGYRDYSISGWSSWHSGIDIVIGGKGSTGVPVVAAASGTVERVDKGYRGYGHMILINHGNGIKTRYAHMQPGSLTVYVGQHVSKGQQIGRIGNTGNSTGPHLHFEVIVNGSTTNPLKYVRN